MSDQQGSQQDHKAENEPAKSGNEPVESGNEPVESRNESRSEPAADVSMQSVDNAAVTEGGAVRNRRPRVKALLQKLTNQLEFYFGDANISKDRFLKQKISEHPQGYVSLELIASFNKMKSLTTNKTLIVQAIEKSPLLEVSPDQKWIRRVTPLPSLSEEEVNARTIYVENLPKSVDHQSLTALFKHFGVVTYVSLPRTKTFNAVKGFAFIEFSTAQEAQSAVQFFKCDSEEKSSNNEPKESSVDDSVFNQSMTESVTLTATSIGETATSVEGTAAPIEGTAAPIEGTTAPIEGTTAPIEETTAPIEGTAASIEETMTTDIAKPSLKRKRESDDEQDNESKRIKETDDDHSTVDSSSTAVRTRQTSECESNQLSRLDSTWSEFSVVDDDDETGVVEGEKKKKKSRKRHKRRESVVQQLKDMKLRVLSKEEWLQMKVLFKQMQKEQMRALKAENRKSDKSTESPPKSSAKGFIGNCLVRVICTTTEESTVTAEQLKTVCSQYGPVAYVDFTQQAKDGYVRYSEQGCVEKLINSGNAVLEGISFEAVNEEGERAYYLKTQATRRQHFLSKRKRKTTRGQDRVISKALKRMSGSKPEKPKPTHVHFSDSDDDGQQLEDEA